MLLAGPAYLASETSTSPPARRRSRFGRRTLLFGALLLALPLGAAGCHKSKRHSHIDPHPTAFASSTEFIWVGDLRNYDALDEYEWNTVWDEVFIEFDAHDFFGEVRVQIYDDAFDEIFECAELRLA